MAVVARPRDLGQTLNSRRWIYPPTHNARIDGLIAEPLRPAGKSTRDDSVNAVEREQASSAAYAYDADTAVDHPLYERWCKIMDGPITALLKHMLRPELTRVQRFMAYVLLHRSAANRSAGFDAALTYMRPYLCEDERLGNTLAELDAFARTAEDVLIPLGKTALEQEKQARTEPPREFWGRQALNGFLVWSSRLSPLFRAPFDFGPGVPDYVTEDTQRAARQEWRSVENDTTFLL